MNEPTKQEVQQLGEMVEREHTMSRQTQRRLYRIVCKQNGVEPHFARPSDKKSRRLARKQANRGQFDRPSRSERNALRKYTNAQRNGQ